MRIRNWIRRPQERDGNCMFSGQVYLTQEVNLRLRPADIIAICLDIRRFVSENGGADYFQVYENDDGDKLYFIDATASEEGDHCVLMYSHEY